MKEKFRKRNKRAEFPQIQPPTTANAVQEWKQVRKYIPGIEGHSPPVFCCETAKCVMCLPVLVSISRMLLMVTDFVPLCQSRLYPILKMSVKSYDFWRWSAISILALIARPDMTYFISNLLSKPLFWTS